MSVSFGTKLVASSPPTGLSARILSYHLLNLSWSQILDAKGYIIKYTPNDETVLVQGGAVLFENIQNLTQGKTYNIKVYSFKELLSESSSEISVLYDGKSDGKIMVTKADTVYDHQFQIEFTMRK